MDKRTIAFLKILVGTLMIGLGAIFEEHFTTFLGGYFLGVGFSAWDRSERNN